VWIVLSTTIANSFRASPRVGQAVSQSRTTQTNARFSFNCSLIYLALWICGHGLLQFLWPLPWLRTDLGRGDG
jgi:hypothetical protein